MATNCLPPLAPGHVGSLVNDGEHVTWSEPPGPNMVQVTGADGKIKWITFAAMCAAAGGGGEPDSRPRKGSAEEECCNGGTSSKKKGKKKSK